MIHARIDPRLDAGGDFVLIHVRPAIGRAIHPVQSAHRPAAEGDFGNFNVAASKTSVFHERQFSRRSTTMHEEQVRVPPLYAIACCVETAALSNESAGH